MQVGRAIFWSASLSGYSGFSISVSQRVDVMTKMNPADLRRQKIEAREKNVLAIIQRDFSASRMNNTKWQKLNNALSDLPVAFRVKFVDVSEALPLFSFWAVMPGRFDSAEYGPFTSVSIEWLDIKPHRIPPLELEEIHAAHEHVERRLCSIHVPYFWSGDYIRVVGHVRKSEQVSIRSYSS